MKKHLILFVTVLSAVSFAFPSLCSADSVERPNIVWIVTEDNSADYLRLYDKDGAAMPNVERLAKNGIVFNNAFSNAPVCSVARSTIISSCYAPRILTQYHRHMEKVPMPEGIEMFPWYLKQAGYYTTNNSKEDYNITKDNDPWDMSSAQASFRNREPGQPFFHVQNYGTTHEGKLHFTAEKMASHETETDPEAMPVYECHPNTELFRYTNAYYRDLHMKVDREIGEFLKQLEDDGLLEDTIIFYYGDHGGVLPGSKGYIYERGVRVPMVVSIPEKWKHLFPTSQGSRVDGFVQFIDLGPTVLNLAGVEIPAGIDGKPFLGKGVELSELNSRDTVFCYADRFDEKYDFVRTLRKGKFKYMRNYQPFNFDGLFNFYRYRQLAYQEWEDLHKKGELTAEQDLFFQTKPAEALYDLENDPFELNNLADEPRFKSELIKLRRLLRKQVRSMPDLSFYPEAHLLQVAKANPTEFGKTKKQAIHKLIQTADLSLRPFSKSKNALKKALVSDSPWQRYWGWIVCSSYGEDAKRFKDQALEAAHNDENNFVRMRAAEFVGLLGDDACVELLVRCLKSAETETEANFILNSIALLQFKHGYDFNITESMVNSDWVENPTGHFLERIKYLKESQAK